MPLNTEGGEKRARTRRFSVSGTFPDCAELAVSTLTVNQVMTEAKTAADTARKGAAKLSFWLTAAMLFGAFAASLVLRDGTWNDRVLTPRPI